MVLKFGAQTLPMGCSCDISIDYTVRGTERHEVIQHTWSNVARTLTSPEGSSRSSTVIGVILSEGGVPSISPPISRKSLRKSPQRGYNVVSVV